MNNKIYIFTLYMLRLGLTTACILKYLSHLHMCLYYKVVTKDIFYINRDIKLCKIKKFLIEF